MPLTLFLLRHAKAVQDDTIPADIDRPLNGRGMRAAEAMGQYLSKVGLLPDLAQVSPALRTQQTWAGLSTQLPAPPNSVTVPELYDFTGPRPLMDVIKQHGGKSKSLMLVAHNPSIHQLARQLVGAGDDMLRAELNEKYSTGALAIISFDHVRWDQIERGTGTLLHFIRPRDLTGE